MSEEEKKTLEYLREGLKSVNRRSDFYKINADYMRILLNLVEKLQKENEKLREKLKLMDDYNNWIQLAIDRRIELEKLYKENEELKNLCKSEPYFTKRKYFKRRNKR